MLDTRSVLLEINYYLPAREQGDVTTVESGLIGVPAKQMQHRPILETFIYNVNDQHDYDSRIYENLKQRFRGRVGMSGDHLAMLSGQFTLKASPEDNECCAPYSSNVVPLFKGLSQEQMHKADFTDMEHQLRLMIPFQKVRAFLNTWHEKMEGPVRWITISDTPLDTVREPSHVNYSNKLEP